LHANEETLIAVRSPKAIAAAERIWSFQSSDRKMIADHQSSTSLT
jgi:hypothetical protein